MINRTFKVINVSLELRRLALSRTRTFNASIQCLARSRLCNTRTSNASIQHWTRSKLCYKNIQLPSPCHSLLSEAASATMFPHFQLHLHKRSDSIIDNWISIKHWKVAAYPAPLWCWWKLMKMQSWWFSLHSVVDAEKQVPSISIIARICKY